MKIEDYQSLRARLPRIHWSTAEYLGVHIQAKSILPFLTVNQTRKSLKLITSDAVRAKALAIDIYLTPFHISTWVAFVVLVFGGTSLIVTAVSKRRGYKSTVGMLKRIGVKFAAAAINFAAAAIKFAAAAKASSLQPQPHVKAHINPWLQS